MRDDLPVQVDLQSAHDAKDWIVCGWFTPDYAPWTEKLVASLNAIGIPHDIVEVPELSGTWEHKTLAKPTQILAAMDRHPGKVILVLDVDCVVVRAVSHLASIIGDVGFFITTKFRRSGGARLRMRSGTVVVRPTLAARRYVENWERAALCAPWGAVDQTAQMVAIGQTPGVSITVLGVEECATAADRVPDPNILHDSASKEMRKTSKWERRLRNLFRTTFKAVHGDRSGATTHKPAKPAAHRSPGLWSHR